MGPPQTSGWFPHSEVPLRLRDPLEHDGLGRDDERLRPRVLEREHGERHDGLAQARLVAEDGAAAPACESTGEPGRRGQT